MTLVKGITFLQESVSSYRSIAMWGRCSGGVGPKAPGSVKIIYREYESWKIL
jgi:hypothetical protein